MEKVTLQIGLILLACLAAPMYGWFHSPQSRRLAIAALIIVAGLIALVMLGVFIVKTWFPLRL